MFRYLRPLPFVPMNPIELNDALQSDPQAVPAVVEEHEQTSVGSLGGPGQKATG